MTTQMPQPFTPIQPNAIASYNFEDIEAGLGYVTYYGVTGSNGFNLVSFSEEGGDPQYSTFGPSTGTFTVADTSVFNYQRTIKGTAYIACTVALAAAGGGNCTFSLYHVDAAAVETLLGSATNLVTTSATKKVFFAQMPLPTKHIKRGEFLRLKVYFEIAGANYLWVYGDASTDPFKLHIPFKLDDTA